MLKFNTGEVTNPIFNQTMKNSLNMVRKHFPNVKKVVDAKEGVRVTVLKRDSAEGRKKSPENCALARACVRELKADGAMINVGTSYIIKGDVATRFITSQTVAREITSFDRHQDFQPGDDYLLSRVAPSRQLGHKQKGKKTRGPHTTHKTPHAVHKTENIRVSAASK